ncbi:hypothetical protein [Nakamurella multipartita]|uniref:Uncharacterized protein n=1 Tax=Nakamurella multipartita (strain ATCC 700099 / DSM 44233 / CIP 104796 / JCM 9543 / NBRC 105858 / Y-104) TaxID=479431 RepID=C8X8P0_NAKMY|nr:hypothetical protein [Nakamurella multipartita]ACV79095.1 hypothetical protein Namu_2749 [Nakamurella multipartita DSM 44233]
MTNRHKRMGDKAEREGFAVLQALASDLLMPGAGREFGAGRAVDVGDLKAFPDVAVQVRRRANLWQAIHTAAADAMVQAANRQVPHALGMVPLMGARCPSVRWLAACRCWPMPLEPDEFVVTGSAMAAARHARDDLLAGPRESRVALACRHGHPDVFVAPIEAWLHAYRRAIRTATPPARVG